ncbi:protein-L-isoaspartate(D-aspartate) O-methyltransferase [Marispirochaeta sp.]|uniref:protein-L-isoaspartate(D-aspartate) O-methyltransferase n=1 Tax=Marispirochaeta sp. TaxID=2038653 RepID=UPI0029C992FF|nr:protein-L-isoaspartate(D-aspartate) O-methyltransferase [Marispirochaeta sp.]
MRSGIHRILILACALGYLASSVFSQSVQDPYEGPRKRMVREIIQDARMTASYTGKENLDESVLETLRTVPRHLFVPDNLKGRAYQNRPLPIGYGQTISQPYIVALMTDLLELKASDRVLEIGTGSAYQAAVLAKLAARVYTLEIIPELAKSAGQRLADLGYDTVTVLQKDGYYGLAGEAPFDAILVTAAATHLPPPLVEQLKPGGRMVIPVGGPFMTQELIRLRKNQDGSISTEYLLPVAFVPLTGGH